MNETPYANSLFEQPWWLNIVAPDKWREILARNKQGEVIGRFAFVTDGKKIFMPEFTQTLGIWMSDKIRSNYGRQKQVINEIFKQLSQFHSCVVALSPENQYILPFRWLGYTMTPCFTYRLTDLSNYEKLLDSFDKHGRTDIHYAQSKVEVFSEVKLSTIWRILNKTFEAQNRKYPNSKELIYRIIQTCEENGHGKYFEARDPKGNVHSCIYLVYDENVCYDLIGGLDRQYQESRSKTLLIWESIKFASRHSKIFDFEGSMVEGIENFYRHFGGVCTPYYYIKRQSLFSDIKDALKPRVKRLIGYKI